MLVIKAFLWLVSCINLHHFSLFYNFYFQIVIVYLLANRLVVL
jgi:hypothetical protein